MTTTRQRIGLTAGVAVLAAGATLGPALAPDRVVTRVASSASAHTPNSDVSCAGGIHLYASSYESGQTNRWYIYRNGVLVQSGTFASSLDKREPVAQGGATTSYRVVIDVVQSNQYDYDRSGTVGPCGTASPTPTPTPTVTPTPTPSSTPTPTPTPTVTVTVTPTPSVTPTPTTPTSPPTTVPPTTPPPIHQPGKAHKSLWGTCALGDPYARFILTAGEGSTVHDAYRATGLVHHHGKVIKRVHLYTQGGLFHGHRRRDIAEVSAPFGSRLTLGGRSFLMPSHCGPTGSGRTS